MYLEVLKQQERLGLRFQRLNHGKKNRAKTFDTFKVTSKLCLVYLLVKLQHDRAGS